LATPFGHRILTTVDLVLRNGRIFTPSGFFHGGIGVEDGRIASLGKDSTLPRADRTVDVKGNIILPGFIDAHCHCHGMERSDWEDFTTGTRAAAAGGFTTILEMPITTPPTSTVNAFREKKEVVARQAIVNFALFGGAGSDNIDEIDGIAREGAVAFKTFMPPPTHGREKDFWGLYVKDDGSFLEMLRAIAQTGLRSCVHAENPEIVSHLMRRVESEGRKDLGAYLESKPGITESEAISRAAMFASVTGARMHICHVCAKEAIEVVTCLRQKGQPLTAETCPHYLTFIHDAVKHLGPYAKVNPPIRHVEDRTRLWEALRTGVIDIVASDHGPFTRDLKEIGRDDIWRASMGFPALDAMIPVMLTHVNQGLISLQELVKLSSENVAKIFGLYPSKGLLQVGADADMAVVDMSRRKKLKTEEFQTKAKDVASIWDGMEVQGVPIRTIVNGTEVMEEGTVLGKPATGQFLRPNATRRH